MSTVALVKCADSSYDVERVESEVRRAVELLGGMAAFVKPGQRVLLKPNLLRWSRPGDAVVTHPVVVRAVVRLVQEAGGRPLIGDSPGGPLTSVWLRAIYQGSGLAAVAEETGATLNYDLGTTRLPMPAGRLLKALDWCQFAANADVIISLPKLKTHGFMGFTGATKNLFGLVPGVTKAGYHAKLSGHEQFADMLLDIVELARPAFSLMDGIVGMDGNGPSAGSPYPLGALLCSTDAVALDLVATQLVGLKVEQALTLQAARRRGQTSGQLDDVQIVGDAFSEVRRNGFRPARTHVETLESAPSLLRRLAIGQVVASPRPTARCTRCAICVQNCPVKAIALKESGPAQIDLGKCIRCYCCHELCPSKAIDLKEPLLHKLLG